MEQTVIGRVLKQVTASEISLMEGASQCRFEVFDQANHQSLIFDATDMNKWGPVGEQVGWLSFAAAPSAS